MAEDLRGRLEAAAQEAGRSLHAEILARLEDSFPVAIEAQLLQARHDELRRVQGEIQMLNAQIADLTLQLRQPSKRKIRGEINEVIAQSSRRVLHLDRIREAMERDIGSLQSFAPAHQDK